MLGIGRNRADVVRPAQPIRRPRDGEQLVLSRNGLAAITDVLRRFVHRAQDTECESVCRTGQFGAPFRIDDFPSVYRDAHIAVAAGSGNVEQAEPFHEEGALLVEEDREALIHLHLKGVALNLTEIGIDGPVECHVGGDAFQVQVNQRFPVCLLYTSDAADE